MFQRLAIIATITAILAGLVLYSQLRPTPQFVSGIVESDEIRLGSRVGGRVESILVAEGDQVDAGAPLIQFEPFDLAERMAQARAVLAERESALGKLNAGMRQEEILQAKSRYDEALARLDLVRAGPREEEIAAAENRLVAAEAELQLARSDQTRLANLADTNSAPRSELDLANQRLEAALSQVAVRENELKILQSGARAQEIAVAEAAAEQSRLAWELAQQGFRSEEIAQAEAARDAAQAALGIIERQQSELVVRAPTAGTIDALDLEPGDLVAPNAPVLSMLAPDPLTIRAYVPQRLLRVSNDDDVRVTLDSFPEIDFRGKVTFVSNQAEFTPGNSQTPDDRARMVFRIHVRLEPQDLPVRAGMTARVWLPNAETESP